VTRHSDIRVTARVDAAPHCQKRSHTGTGSRLGSRHPSRPNGA